MASRPQRRKPENRKPERIDPVAKEADPGSVLEEAPREMGRMGPPSVDYKSLLDPSPIQCTGTLCAMTHARMEHPW